MADDPIAPSSADDELGTGGYRAELRRTLGGFAVFAISFAFISSRWTMRSPARR